MTVESDNHIQAAIDAGMGLSEPYSIGTAEDEGRFYSVTVPVGAQQKVLDLEELREKFRLFPRRKTGTVIAHDADSFVALLAKHGLPETEIYADAAKSTVTAILNTHGPNDQDGTGIPGWGDHRLHLALQITQEWQAWTSLDRKMIGQVAFAEHIEDRLIDILDPPSAVMLEIAQSLSVKRDVTFESSNRLASGQRTLHYRENDNASAGQRGDLSIPEMFTIALRPYKGGEAYQIPARLRYRINDGQLQLGFVLDRPAEVLENAFLDVRTKIELDSGGRTIFAGSFDR